MDLDWVRVLLRRTDEAMRQAEYGWKDTDGLLAEAEAQWTDSAARGVRERFLEPLRGQTAQAFDGLTRRREDLGLSVDRLTEADARERSFLAAAEEMEQAAARAEEMMRGAERGAEEADRTAAQAQQHIEECRHILAGLSD